ncbi:MAG: GtrA family protein [Methanomassiliicoccaceae archaeon]|jgi:putative flippase GtrA|nr:GtrA family protein [Methanomassiliicoccaceae archaeon]
MGFKEIFNDHREVVLYVFFGAFTVLVSLGSYAVFVWLGVALVVSNILSWICGILFAFVVNKWFVFENRSKEPAVIARELGAFVGARIFTFVVAVVLFPILLSAGLNGYIFGVEGAPARGVTSLVEIVLNYALSKYLIFTKKTVRNDPKNDM